MRSTGLVLACCLALIAGASSTTTAQTRSPAAQVTVSKPATSLPGSTYAWVPMPPTLPVESDPRVQDPALRARLQASLDKVLQAKGYRLIDDIRQADMAVAYRVGMRDLQQAIVRDTGLASAPESAIGCSGEGCSQIVTRGDNGVPTIKVEATELIEGGLMIEVIQPSDYRVLWRALYRGSVRAKDAGTVDLDEVAARTLKQLPRAPGE